MCTSKWWTTVWTEKNLEKLVRRSRFLGYFRKKHVNGTSGMDSECHNIVHHVNVHQKAPSAVGTLNILLVFSDFFPKPSYCLAKGSHDLEGKVRDYVATNISPLHGPLVPASTQYPIFQHQRKRPKVKLLFPRDLASYLIVN